MNNDEELDLETEPTETITSSGSLKATPKNPDMTGYEAQAKANKAAESMSMAKVLGRFDADIARKAIAEQTGDITTLDAIQRNTDGGARVGADGLYLAPVPQVDKILGDNTPEGRAIYENNFRRNEAKLQLITDEYKKSKIREGRSVAENVLADTAYIAGSGVAGIADILTSGVGLIGMGGGMLIQGIGTLGGKDNMVVDLGVFLQDLSVQELNAYNDWVKRNLNKLTPTGTVEVVGEIAQNVVPVAASVAATVATGGAAAPTVAAAASARGISSAVARRLTNQIANQAAKKIAKATAATYAAAATQQYLAREAEGKTSQEYQDYLRQKTGGDILSDAAWGVVVGYTNYWLEKAFGAEASIGRYFGRGSTGLMRAAGRSGLEESITEVAQDTSLNVADYLRYLAGNEDRGMTLEDVYNNFVSEDTLKTFVLSAAIGGFTGAGEYATARSNLVKEYKTNLKKVFPTATEEQLETAGKAFIRSTEDNVVSKVKQSLIADDQLINQYGTYHAIVQNRLNELIDQSIAQGKELAFKDKSPEYQAQFVGSTAQRFVDELYSQAVLRGVPVSEVFDTTQMQVDNGILYMYGTEYGRRPLSQFTREMTPEQWYRAQNEARIADELQKKQKAAAEATRKAEREARAAERQRVAEERKLARELAQQEREARAAERAAERQRAAEAKQTAADEAALPFRDYLAAQGVASVDDLTNREAIRDSRVFARAEIRDMEENVARGILAQLRSDLPVLTMKQSEIKQILRGEIDRFIALQDRAAIKPIQAAPSMLDRQRAVVERKRRIAKPLSFSQNMREAGISKDAVERLGLEGEFKKILDKNYRFYVRRNGKISNFEEIAMEYKYQDRYETTRTQPATVNDFLELLEQDLKTKNIYSYQDEAALRNWEENSIRAERERQQQIMGENAEAKAYLETNGVDTTGMTDEQILSEAGKLWNQNNPTLTMDDDIELGEDVPDDLYFQTEKMSPAMQQRKTAVEDREIIIEKLKDIKNQPMLQNTRTGEILIPTPIGNIRIVDKSMLEDQDVLFGYEPATRSFIVPVPKIQNKTIPQIQDYILKQDLKTAMFHEDIHRLDHKGESDIDIRSEFMNDVNPNVSLEEYFNRPEEAHAYAQQRAAQIAENISNMSIEDRLKVVGNDEFVDRMTNNVAGYYEWNAANKDYFRKLMDDLKSYVLNNLTDTRYYQKTIGAWNPLRKTIELGTGANETTIAHELSHFWLDNMMMYSRLAQAAQNEGFMRVWKNIKRYLDIDDRQDVVNVAQAEKYTSAYMQYIRNNKIAPVSDLGFKGLDEYIGDISLDYFENAMHREEDGTYSSELEKLTPEIVEALQALTTTDLSRYRDTILDIQSGEMPIGDITDARLGKEATPEQMRTSGAAEARAQQDKQITEALKAAEADAQPITTPETTPSMKAAEEVIKSAKDTSSRYEIGTTDEESFAKAREIIANNRDLAEQAVLEDPSGITDGIANEFIALELAQQAMQQGRNTTPYLASFVNGASAAGANLRVASLLNKPELAWAKDIYEASKAREYAVALRMRPAVKNAIMNRSAIVRAMESRLDEYVEKLYPQLLQAQSYEEQVKIINDWGNNTARELGITPSTDMWYQTIGGNVGAKKTDFTKAVGYQKRKLKDFLKSKLGEGLSDAEQLKVRELHRNAIDALRELRSNPTDQATKINFIRQTRAYQDYLNALQPANWATSLFASIPRASMLFRISTQVKNTLGTRVEILLSDINRTMRYGKGSLIADKDIDAEIKDSMNMFSIGGFSPDVQESFFESPTLAWGEKQFSLIARGGEKRGAILSKERLMQDAKDIAEYARNNWKSDDPNYKKAWVATKIALGTVERTVGKSFDILAYSDAFMKADIAVKETAKAATFYAKAEGKANNWTQAQIKARAYELFADARSYIPKTKLGESIRKRAVEQAKLETFIKSGTLAQMANNVRNALNLGKESGIGTFISPFVSTPANVMQLGVDYATGWWRRFGSQTITAKDGSTITLGWKECKQRIQENAAAGKPINEYDMEWLEKGYRGSFGGLFLATMLALFKGAQAITGDDDVLDYVPPYQSLNARERQYYRAVNGGKYNAIKVGNVWVNAEYFGGLSEAITTIGTWYHNNSVISSLTTEIMRTPVVGDLLETKQDFDRDIQYNKSLLDSAFEGASSQLSKYIPGIIQDIDRAREKGALYVGFGGSFGITTDSDVKSVKDAQMDSGAAYSPITRGKAFSGIDQATKRKINRDFDELYNADAAKWLRTHPSAKPEAKKKALNDIRKTATAKIKRKYKIK